MVYCCGIRNAVDVREMLETLVRTSCSTELGRLAPSVREMFQRSDANPLEATQRRAGADLGEGKVG